MATNYIQTDLHADCPNQRVTVCAPAPNSNLNLVAGVCSNTLTPTTHTHQKKGTWKLPGSLVSLPSAHAVRGGSYVFPLPCRNMFLAETFHPAAVGILFVSLARGQRNSEPPDATCLTRTGRTLLDLAANETLAKQLPSI